MKKHAFLFSLLLALTMNARSSVYLFEQNEMAQRNDDGKNKINILMLEQADPIALNRAASQFATKQERCEFVVETLKQQAEASQADLMCLLREMESNGMVNYIQPFWLVNCVSCMANKAAINDLAQRGDILTIYHCQRTGKGSVVKKVVILNDHCNG